MHILYYANTIFLLIGIFNHNFSIELKITFKCTLLRFEYVNVYWRLLHISHCLEIELTCKIVSFWTMFYQFQITSNGKHFLLFLKPKKKAENCIPSKQWSYWKTLFMNVKLSRDYPMFSNFIRVRTWVPRAKTTTTQHII